jgi:hypothetical protein
MLFSKLVKIHIETKNEKGAQSPNKSNDEG